MKNALAAIGAVAQGFQLIRGHEVVAHCGMPPALIHDPDAAADRLVAFLQTDLMPVANGPPIPLRAQSICVHGDSPGAVQMAIAVRQALAAAGVDLRPFAS